MGDREVGWEWDQPQALHLDVGDEGARLRREMEMGDWWVESLLYPYNQSQARMGSPSCQVRSYNDHQIDPLILLLLLPSARIEAEAGEEQENQEVPPLIHMVWVGSPLPSRYLVGPHTFARLNPGQRQYVHVWRIKGETWL